ncbi:hypothetical protein [Shewanella maritima]|uniref:hypothetical protein n=1 Tax=Shewanella maritima TaxID=2520507 RepID=UPI0037359A12
MNLNHLFKAFHPKKLFNNMPAVLAVLTFIAIMMVSIALLPFLLLFVAISFITFSLFGRKWALAKMKAAQSADAFEHHPNVEREQGFRRATQFGQPTKPHQGRTFEHQAD